LVQEAELEAAEQPHYTVSEWVHFGDANYVPIRGAHSISGKIQLLPTPGHTPGHQSLVVRSQSGIEVVVGQAAYTAAEFQLFFDHRVDEPDSPLNHYIQSNATWSSESYITSLALLRETRPDRARFSHDPTVWTRAV
jgi:glyoxylase-like metal-dependent hydrolase (beta-lactamase superfamily II)